VRPVKNCDVPDQARHPAARFFFNDRRNLFFLLFLLEVIKFNFDQFMAVEGFGSRFDQGFRDAFLTDKHDGFQFVGEPS